VVPPEGSRVARAACSEDASRDVASHFLCSTRNWTPPDCRRGQSVMGTSTCVVKRELKLWRRDAVDSVTRYRKLNGYGLIGNTRMLARYCLRQCDALTRPSQIRSCFR